MDAILLAGGKSTRMNENKMLKVFDGKSLIIHTVESLYDVVKRIIVVTGKYHEEIKEALKDYNKVVIIRNEEYEKGMFSSVKVGVSLTNSDFLIIPGDCPFIKPSTFKKITETKALIAVATYKNHRGHPIFFNKMYKDLLIESTDKHLKAFRNRYDFEDIEVDDEGVLIDIDTIDDLNNVLKHRKEE